MMYFQDFKEREDTMSLDEIILSIGLSIAASFVFWLFSFKVSFTKIIFANSLAKPDDTLTDDRKLQGYRFRFANVGFRDLIELDVTVKMVIEIGTRNCILRPDISNSGEHSFVTFLPGIITYKLKKGSNMRTMTFYPSESMRKELSKDKYPTKIRDRAKNGNLQFKDISDIYGGNVTIRIYVYGNDRTTGARKMFESQAYTMNENDIKEGDFVGRRAIHFFIFDRNKVKRDKMSEIQ